MGQGFHSKVIFGVVLDAAATERFAALYETDAALYDRINNYLNRLSVSSSYDVAPVWFGVPFASTDNVVARINRIQDIEGGVKINDLIASFDGAKIAEAEKAMKKVVGYLGKNGFEVGSADFYLVTDYH